MTDDIVHKAVFIWNESKNMQQLTACGRLGFQFTIINKVSDWNEVTCKRCLKLKDTTPISTVTVK